MTSPRLRYPKRGLPAPPGVHIENPMGMAEANFELEGLVNFIDGGTDTRVTIPPGAAPGITPDLAAILAAIQARGLDTADATRAVRSSVDALIYELQHPKRVLYTSTGNVAIGPGANVAITPWIDTDPYRWIGWYFANTGQQNAIAGITTYLSESVIGEAPFLYATYTALALAGGGVAFSQDSSPTGWMDTHLAPLTARYFRLYATGGASPTTGQACVKGMR